MQLGPASSRLAKDRYLWDHSREGSPVRKTLSPYNDDDVKNRFGCSLW